MPDLSTTPVVMSEFAQSIFKRTYAFNEHETWEECAQRVAKAVANDHKQEEQFFTIIKDRIFIPGGRYLYAAGRTIQQFNNCTGFIAEDSREGWADLMRSVTMCLSMGAGLGVNYSKLRAAGATIGRLGGVSSGPLALMQMVNSVARYVMMGGSRRSALLASLHWAHPDINNFLSIKDWNTDTKAMKAKNVDYPAPLDQTNISVWIDDEYISKLKENDPIVTKLHSAICESMMRHGEPGILNLSRRLKDDPKAFTLNACAETQLHHADVCNLGSIVLPRIQDLSHLEEVTRLAIQFLYNGSIKSSYPTDEIATVAAKNRRLGLGLMGIHEFMLLHNHQYEWFPELQKYISTWAQISTDEAHRYAIQRGAIPIATRAIAPTGTISLMAETTSGIEPIFCTAYQRRYLNNGRHQFQFVVDPTTKRLLDLGLSPDKIEDAYTLSTDIPRRLNVQTNMQKFTDQAISNTINLPAWETQLPYNIQAFTEHVATSLHDIKGLTAYPHGARTGQPISPVPLEEAINKIGIVYEEETERCSNGTCGL